jgi:hypothetical protein
MNVSIERLLVAVLAAFDVYSAGSQKVPTTEMVLWGWSVTD